MGQLSACCVAGCCRSCSILRKSVQLCGSCTAIIAIMNLTSVRYALHESVHAWSGACIFIATATFVSTRPAPAMLILPMLLCLLLPPLAAVLAGISGDQKALIL